MRTFNVEFRCRSPRGKGNDGNGNLLYLKLLEHSERPVDTGQFCSKNKVSYSVHETWQRGLSNFTYHA